MCVCVRRPTCTWGFISLHKMLPAGPGPVSVLAHVAGFNCKSMGCIVPGSVSVLAHVAGFN